MTATQVSLGGPSKDDTEESRRSLRDIRFNPTPGEILKVLQTSPGWKYKTHKETYLIRDRALIVITYILAARISEVLKLTRGQFLFPFETGMKDRILVRGLELAKAYKSYTQCADCDQKGLKNDEVCKQCGGTNLVVKKAFRRDKYRDDAFLPLIGARKPLTILAVHWIQRFTDPDSRLFRFGRQRAWQIIEAMTGSTCHWFRAFGEDYLYDQWDSDIIAVADYIKVDPRTIPQYIRRRYQKYLQRKGAV